MKMMRARGRRASSSRRSSAHPLEEKSAANGGENSAFCSGCRALVIHSLGYLNDRGPVTFKRPSQSLDEVVQQMPAIGHLYRSRRTTCTLGCCRSQAATVSVLRFGFAVDLIFGCTHLRCCCYLLFEWAAIRDERSNPTPRIYRSRFGSGVITWTELLGPAAGLAVEEAPSSNGFAASKLPSA